MSARDRLRARYRPVYNIADAAYFDELLAAVVAEAKGETAIQPPASATSGLTERQVRLLDAIRTHGGEWTTRRVLSLFALTDPGVVQRGTARRDLATLHRAGHLVLVDAPNHRHYVLNTRGGGPR